MKKIVILGTFLLTSLLQAGQVFYVVPNGAGNKDGTRWANAFADVQDAIDAAAAVATNESPSEVWIAAGTYKHGSQMTMKNNVAIYGGFAGTETSKAQRIAGENKTYLDGEESYCVFYNTYPQDNPLTNSAKLDNVIIQNGSSVAGGGGMSNHHASPEITNCTFSNNTTTSYGGGMFNIEGNPTLTNCTFSGNTADSSGGGMYNASGSQTLINCTFSANTASSSSGGGIYNSGGLILTNCTFTANTASTGAGMAMSNSSGNPTITNCIFWGNTASSGNDEINIHNCDPSFDTCIIQGGIESIYNLYSTCTYKNIITADPKLGELGDYGGSVQTIPVLEGSSAIGMGRVVGGISTDARGVARSGIAPTIGAYESETIIVITPPAIATQPSDISVEFNGRGSLSIEASGYALTYQWYKDGAPVEGEESAALNFVNIRAANAGSYYCVVSNPEGNIQTNTVSVTVTPRVYYVVLNGAGSKDGTSWENAYANVQTAINKAASAAADLSKTFEVWVAAGTYNSASAIALKSKVAVYGGFVGTETSKDQRTAGNETIFVGTSSSSNLFNISGTDNYASLNDLTIRKPNSTKSAVSGAGYASIRNCRFVDCTITNTSSGAAMSFNGEGCPTVSNCEFVNCSTQWSAGAIYIRDGAIKVENCYFEGCNSLYASVLHSNNSNVEIVNCTLNNNYSTSSASNEAIQCANGSQAKVVYCTIIQSPDCNGCAFEVDASSCLVYNSILLNNNYGSIVVDHKNGTTFEVHNCLVDKKYSDGDIVTADAKLNEAAYNGGFVKTMAVRSGSPAILSAQAYEGVATDARGVVRYASAPTIGAYEYEIPSSGYERWAADNGLSGADVPPSAIPHSDGIMNLEKFAFGLDGTKAASYADNPHFAQSVEGGAVVLAFPISVDAEGYVSVKALMSTDLINWTETTATATGTSKDGKFKLFKANEEIPEGGKIFLKLKVEQ